MSSSFPTLLQWRARFYLTSEYCQSPIAERLRYHDNKNHDRSIEWIRTAHISTDCTLSTKGSVSRSRPPDGELTRISKFSDKALTPDTVFHGERALRFAEPPLQNLTGI